MNDIIQLLETYKYFILFPLAIIEGPFLTIIAGFLVTLGIFNAYIVFPIVVIGDAIGDTLIYSLGRYGSNFLGRYGHLIGVTKSRLDSAKNYYRDHHLRSVALSKLVHGIGFIGIVTAGTLKVPYIKFALTALSISILQSAILLVIGLFFGYAYVEIGQYLNYFAATISLVAVGVILFIGIQKYRKNKHPKM